MPYWKPRTENRLYGNRVTTTTAVRYALHALSIGKDRNMTDYVWIDNMHIALDATLRDRFQDRTKSSF
eukprot:scaffold158842_cov33-Attheya_sp.AAC.1